MLTDGPFARIGSAKPTRPGCGPLPTGEDEKTTQSPADGEDEETEARKTPRYNFQS